MRFRVFDKTGPAGEVPLPPWCDHLDVRIETVIAELEPHLVIAFAGCAMQTASAPVSAAISI